MSDRIIKWMRCVVLLFRWWWNHYPLRLPAWRQEWVQKTPGGWGSGSFEPVNIWLCWMWDGEAYWYQNGLHRFRWYAHEE